MATLRRFKSYLRLFLVGALIHTIILLAVVNFDSTKYDFICGEISCWVLVVIDFPLSLIFLSGNNLSITKYSLLFGAFWWGLLMVVISKLVGFIKNKLFNLN